MEGATTCYFVRGGIAEALRLAKQAAADKDVKIGGGVSTVRQYLQVGLIDSMHFAVAPVALGEGEAMLPGLDLRVMGFSVTEHALHVVLTRG
jgi:dihydrofolate reductase